MLTDINMRHFLKHGIRGGISMCFTRKAEANNRFLPNYHSTKPTSYLPTLTVKMYMDGAIRQYVPRGNFLWLFHEEIQGLAVSDKSVVGYILEVDLEIDSEHTDYLNGCHLCPEASISPVKSNKSSPRITPTGPLNEGV